MPWAHEAPLPLEQTVELLRGFRGAFDLGRDYVYGILARDESEAVGGSGLHTRVGAEAFEIGYWIRAGRSGEGLGTEATAALARVGIELCGAGRIEIRVDPENAASLAIPRKLGFTEEGRLRRVLHWADGASDFEFQRLHGMGEGLYDDLIAGEGVRARIYAPIGGYRESPLGPSPRPTALPLWVQLRQQGKKVVTATRPGGDQLARPVVRSKLSSLVGKVSGVPVKAPS